MERDTWNSHQWPRPHGRVVEVVPGTSVIQQHCSRCKRDFVEDLHTGERYAVYVSVFSFRRFPESISKRWLGELCPGGPIPDDIELRTKLIQKLCEVKMTGGKT